MEGNLRQEISPDVAMEGCEQRKIGKRSEMTGLTRDNSRNLADYDKLACTGHWVSESMSTEWTNEKHNLYLNFMEASFVRQLYKQKNSSVDFLGQHSRIENLPHPISSHESHASSNTSSSQFKVLQQGCWRKVNFERARPKLDKVDTPHVILENQPREVTIPNLQENEAQSSRSIVSGVQKRLACEVATSAKNLPACYSHLSNQYSFGINSEVSDQNFVDEDYKGEHLSRTKRMKTVSPDILIKDQVVPIKKSPIL